MIDLARDKLLKLSEAARLLPVRRGRKVSTVTISRWIRRGHRGVRLEGFRTPAGWVTTAAAVQAFLEVLTTIASEERPVANLTSSSSNSAGNASRGSRGSRAGQAERMCRE